MIDTKGERISSESLYLLHRPRQPSSPYDESTLNALFICGLLKRNGHSSCELIDRETPRSFVIDFFTKDTSPYISSIQRENFAIRSSVSLLRDFLANIATHDFGWPFYSLAFVRSLPIISKTCTFENTLIPSSAVRVISDPLRPRG